MYGRPLTSTDVRPGTVTAAGWITLVVSGLSALLYGFLTLAMIVDKDDVLREIDEALAEQGSTGDFDSESAFGVVVGVLVVVVVWCLIACVLAVFVLRRSNAARITLVVSAVVAGLLSLLGIKSAVSAIPLLACRRDGDPAVHRWRGRLVRSPPRATDRSAQAYARSAAASRARPSSMTSRSLQNAQRTSCRPASASS